MSFLQYGLMKTIYLRNTYPVLEPDCALLIFHEVWAPTFYHQVFNFLNLNITNPTFLYLLLQGRFHFYGNSLCMGNYSHVKLIKLLYQLIR